jgi:hypothetical protein
LAVQPDGGVLIYGWFSESSHRSDKRLVIHGFI